MANSANHLQVIENENPKVVEYIPSAVQTIDMAAKNLNDMYALAKKVLRLKVDYDTIPGTPKPSLLKPGAERLLQFFGLGHRVECINKIEDWEKGFFFYHYKVTITHPKYPDFIVAECEGSANSKEKRYRNQDVYTIVNTLQKMAIKRALVGATLQATGASGLFTQDVEDMDLQPKREQTQRAPQPQQAQQVQQPDNDNEPLASEKQVNAIYAVAKSKNVSDDELNALFAKIDKASAKELTRKEASQLIEFLKNKEESAKAQPASKEQNFKKVYDDFDKKTAGAK